MWSTGMITYLCTVFYCHGLFLLHIRDFNWVLFGLVIFLFGWIPFLIAQN